MEADAKNTDGLSDKECNSDTDSFVDALEDLCLQDENPVVFDSKTESNILPKKEQSSQLSGAGDSNSSVMQSEKSSDLKTEQDAKTPSESDSKDSDVQTNSDEQINSPSESVSKDRTGTSEPEENLLAEQIASATGEAEDAEAKTGTDDEEDDKDEGATEDPPVIDEEEMKRQEADLTEEEKQLRKDNAQAMKSEGNDRFKAENYQGAVESYTDALMTCPICYAKELSIMYSNRAASKMKLGKDSEAIEDCTKALEYNPNYLKALLRRAELYEKEDKLEDALTDYGKALEMDRSLAHAREASRRLPGQIQERNEKMKAEMLGKLKDLGNLVLRPFGLSTNNFNLQQDPNTGSYSVQFQQNAPPAESPPSNGK